MHPVILSEAKNPGSCIFNELRRSFAASGSSGRQPTAAFRSQLVFHAHNRDASLVSLFDQGGAFEQ